MFHIIIFKELYTGPSWKLGGNEENRVRTKNIVFIGLIPGREINEIAAMGVSTNSLVKVSLKKKIKHVWYWENWSFMCKNRKR